MTGDPLRAIASNLDALVAERDRLKTALGDEQAHAGALRKAAAELRTDLTATRAKLLWAREWIDRHLPELARLRPELQAALAERDRLTEQLGERITEREELRTELATASRRMEGLTAACAFLQAENVRLGVERREAVCG
jgi:predicted  nucleic acid-binding Zn-ribbon protein